MPVAKPISEAKKAKKKNNFRFFCFWLAPKLTSTKILRQTLKFKFWRAKPQPSKRCNERGVAFGCCETGINE